MNMQFKKLIACGLVMSTLALNAFSPAWADQSTEKSATPEISPWAYGVLVEGEKYGIYPQSWYYEGFTKNITTAKVDALVKETSEKMAELGLEKDPAFKPLAVTNKTTRAGVLTLLYNTVAQYKMPESYLKPGVTPTDFMQATKVIAGSKKGLELEKVCTTEQAVIFATKLIRNTFTQFQAGSEGFLWKTQKGNTTVYMLGSIHIGDPALYPMDQELVNAFAASDALLVEANLFDQTGGMAYLQEKSVYTDKTMLKDVVSKDVYEKVQKAFAKFGIDEKVYEKAKPWSATNTLSVLSMSAPAATSTNEKETANAQQAAQESASLGIDLYYTTLALMTGKPIVELEGLKFQADLFDNISPKLQEENLKTTAEQILSPDPVTTSASANILDEWLKQWQSGDVDAFAKSYATASGEMDSEYAKVLFGERDKNMTEKIAKILESGESKTYFVVVGSGHLALKNGIPDRLKALGYTVESVDFDGEGK